MNAPRSVRLALALRLGAGLVLASGVAQALVSPELALPAKLVAVALAALTAWDAAAGIAALIAITPAGLLLAASPARAAELLAWSFLSAWLLSIRRPIGPRPAGLTPALLFALCAIASWAGYTIQSAPGIEPMRLPLAIARGIDAGHLLFSSPEPETYTLLALLAGLALFSAAAMIARDRPSVRRHAVAALVMSAAVMGTLTVLDVLRQWAGAGYTARFLLRYVRGERFSFHLPDLNAAGSLYVLGGLAAIAMAAGDRGRRGLWLTALGLMLPALYLSGSRSAALGALIVGGALIVLTRRRDAVRIAPAHVLLLVLVLGGAGIAVVTASSGNERGTAVNSLRLRSQFLVTSGRMFASAPVFGVGIGHYHERSNEFMPPALREVYRHENAHNYFAQQFAELGLIGGLLFSWLIVGVLWHGWKSARDPQHAEPAAVALLAASLGYAITCVTGHPLLVPEAALPFWGALGVLASIGTPSRPHRAAIAGATLVIALGLVLDLRQFALATTQPGERGFYALETAPDGAPFVWMTRHGVFYAKPQPGTLVVPVQAPGFVPPGDPFVVKVEVGGERVGSYEVTAGGWTNIRIPVRERASRAFRRIDLRVNRSWSPKQLGRSETDDGPRSVMVGETRYIPAGGR